MPAFTFTADNTNEQLTITAHGLVTGDGPATPRNVGGALPAPLVALTEYWIIRVDANTIKLATSQANAIAGTAVNLTTNGTGTNTLEIGIPYRRARTYAALSQVKSADLNAMQDAHTALYDLLTGQAQGIWSQVDLATPWALTGIITPATLGGGNTNDYAPTGLAAANVIRQTPEAGGTSVITGLTGGTNGRVITIHNIGAANLSFAHDATSTAANRFLLPGAATLVISQQGSATFWYDTTSSRWRLLSKGA